MRFSAVQSYGSVAGRDEPRTGSTSSGPVGRDSYGATAIYRLRRPATIFGDMDNDFDPQRQAEAAMKEAVRTDGAERQRWIQVAQPWVELCRPAPPNRSGPRGC